MEPTPTASNPKIPNTQQEAQDTILDYLQRTVDGLPPGTKLDSADARGGRNSDCDDDFTGPGPGPTAYSVWTRVIGPPGVEPEALIAAAGELWSSWGMQVMERDGFEKPNRFGYSPDGYRLQLQAVYPPEYPPTLIAISPCFPGAIREDSIPFPDLITQSPQP